jgi:hypothetical protein
VEQVRVDARTITPINPTQEVDHVIATGQVEWTFCGFVVAELRRTSGMLLR